MCTDEKESKKRTRYECQHTGKEVEGPDSTPCCKHCDPETGKCSALIKNGPRSGSGSRASGSGGMGSGKVYRFKDTSARGRDSSPYGAKGRGSPDSNQDEDLQYTQDDLCSRTKKNDSGEKGFEIDPIVEVLEAYEREFDKLIAESEQLGNDPFPGTEEVPEWGLFLSEPSHIEEYEERFEEETVNQSPLPYEGECIEAATIGYDLDMDGIDIVQLDREGPLEDGTSPTWGVNTHAPDAPWLSPFGDIIPDPIEQNPLHDPYDFS